LTANLGALFSLQYSSINMHQTHKLFQRQASNLRLRHTSRRYLFLINHYYPPLLNILSWQHIVKQLKIVSGIVFRVSKTLTVLSPFWLGEILMMLHS